MNRRRLLLALLGLAGSSGIARAATVIGKVTRAQGACDGLSEGASRLLQVDAPVHLAEVISTGAGARLELTFDDGTRLTLGERARVTIDRFVYAPGAAGNAIRVSARGAFRFVSGQVTKTADASASIVTPLATIGIRGTDFWGGPIDGAFGVFLLEGAVSVATTSGETILSAPGEGVNITPPGPPLRGAAPAGPVSGPVTQWTADKAARALSAVTFN